MRAPLETIAQQDQSFTWYYRVIGYNAGGGVTGSLLCESDDALEATHEHVLAHPGTRSVFTVGPFRRGRR